MLAELCPRLLSEGVEVNTSSRGVGTVVGVTCAEGYSLSGQGTITCGQYGHWLPLTPTCKGHTQDEGHQLLIIVVCSVASAVALVVLIFGLYMLFTSMRRERKAKEAEQEKEQTMRDIRLYQTVIQDFVGMPAVVHDNMNSTLRGRASTSDESATTGSSTVSPSYPLDITDQKVFIY